MRGDDGEHSSSSRPISGSPVSSDPESGLVVEFVVVSFGVLASKSDLCRFPCAVQVCLFGCAHEAQEGEGSESWQSSAEEKEEE